MANFYSGPSKGDSEYKLGPLQGSLQMHSIRKRPQQQNRGQDWKPAPSAYPHFWVAPPVASDRFVSERHWLLGERENDPLSPLPEFSTAVGSQAPTRSFRSLPVAMNNSGFVEVSTPLSDSRKTFCEEDLAHPPLAKSYPIASTVPLNKSYEAAAMLNDSDNDQTAAILAALVNQLLEDTDGDNFSVKDTPHFNKSPQSFCGDETVGELAIKLADISLIGSDFAAQPGQTGTSQPACNNVIIHSQIGGNFQEPQSDNPLTERSNLKTNKYQKAAVAQGKASNDASGAKKRNDSISMNYQKKKYFSSNGSFNKNSNNLKDSKKSAFNNSSASHGGKQGQRSAFKGSTGPSFVPRQPENRRFKGPSSPYAGATYYMHDSKSDGSSSSNSSVYKDPTSNSTSDFMKYKPSCKSINSEEASPLLSFKQSRRVSKAYSTSSGSSGGGKYSECVLCKTNGETSAIYRSHVLKDENGLTVCEVLQKYVCPLCGATGVHAHTVKYCPKNRNPPPIAIMTTLKSMRSSTGRKRTGLYSGHIRPIPHGCNRNRLPA